jgi:transcriptional regulator with XRE-family HTH domain
VSDDIGGRILALRTGKGLTQRDLAEPNYTAAYVSSVENGHRVPSNDALAHFATRLSVDVTQLTTGRHPGDALSTEIDLLQERQPQRWYAQLAADQTEPPLRRAAAEVVLGRRALTAGAPDDAAAHFERARRLIPPTLAHLRSPAVVGLALCARVQGDPGYAAYLLTGFRDELQRAGLPDPSSMLAIHAVLALCQSDLGEDAIAAAETALGLAGPGLGGPGAGWPGGQGAGGRGAGELGAGLPGGQGAGGRGPGYGADTKDTATTRPNASTNGPGAGVAEAQLAMARTLAASSHLVEARSALAAAAAAIMESWLADEIAGAHRIRARARLSAGDLAGALTDLTAARRRSVGAAALDALVDLAEVHRALGDPATARALLAEAAQRQPSGVGDPAADVRKARAHRVDALLSQDAGDLDAAERQLRAAIGIHRRTGPRRELAQLCLDLADLLTAMRRPEDALTVLADGLTAVDSRADDAGISDTGGSQAGESGAG